MEPSRKKHILIVDDEPDNLQLIFETFEEAQLPYIVTKAPNGEVALRVIEKQCPDIIITDWDMPAMNGIELITRVKQMECGREMPIIMCSGVMTTSANLQTALDAGAIDYIRKPIDKIELISRTQSALILAESRQEILRQNCQLKELNTTKDKFFSIIAHDLRSPIGAVISLTQVLKEGVDEFDKAEIKQYVDLLLDTTENGFRLLENLLEWAKRQLGKTTYEPINFDLHQLVSETLAQQQQFADEKKIKLRCKVSKGLFVYGDRDMIGTVIRNLLSNAIKFTPEKGKICIETSKRNGNVTISVIDTGIGIKPENIQKLFRIDESFSTSGTNNEPGTGLGLSLCQDFVRDHGSEIEAESEPGEGSTFSFMLPFVEKKMSFF